MLCDRWFISKFYKVIMVYSYLLKGVFYMDRDLTSSQIGRQNILNNESAVSEI